LSDIVLIGHGKSREGDIVYWDANWNELAGPVGSHFSGFMLGPGGTKRWGTNRLDQATVLEDDENDTDILSFRAGFDRFQTDYEAQGAGGDSGGGAYYRNGANWELLGIIQSVSTEPDQPGGTAAYGNTTNFADLTQYRDQILRIMDPYPWQNPANPLDVDDDSHVWAIDALAIINEINTPLYSDPVTGALPVPRPDPEGPLRYPDVYRDNYVSPIDALLVINRLNEPGALSASFAAERLVISVAASVPEPSTVVLVVMGVFWLTVGVRRRSA
jgi:hypothetical protein